MTVELLQTLSLVAYIVAGIFLLVAIALFFLLDVPKLYGDVSGRTARKAIENIRLQNESSGNKAYKPSAVNAERGKLTDRITQSGRLESQSTASDIHVGTEKFATSMLAPQSLDETVMAGQVNETTILTGDLFVEAGQTAFLDTGCGYSGKGVAGEFRIDIEMEYIGSTEIIE